MSCLLPPLGHPAGKNRALDEEELEFLDGVYDMEHASEQAKQKEEQQELNAFRLVLPPRMSCCSRTLPHFLNILDCLAAMVVQTPSGDMQPAVTKAAAAVVVIMMLMLLLLMMMMSRRRRRRMMMMMRRTMGMMATVAAAQS